MVVASVPRLADVANTQVEDKEIVLRVVAGVMVGHTDPGWHQELVLLFVLQ